MKALKILFAAAFLMMPLSTSVDAADMNKWKRSLVKQISKYKKYPRSAMNREIEGRAVVRVIFNPDGSVASHEVLQSTGAKVLDREIPKVIGKLKMPALPTGKELAIKIPFTWALG
ncbi:TonB family protein [Temperatibacter marinus]|uniref:TonB family protein n=1 Tax=Temperatibacter marinus TaxID=1456591 RepID=A0AA52HAP6_9PROT|nr:TonB family protein [Temperatibacter marinus]WND03817.1 TonB family protein [Temperatibacter marinus]